MYTAGAAGLIEWEYMYTAGAAGLIRVGVYVYSTSSRSDKSRSICIQQELDLWGALGWVKQQGENS
jgi:hypothetical protein